MKFHKFVTAIAKCRYNLLPMRWAQMKLKLRVRLSFIWVDCGNMLSGMPVCAQTSCREYVLSLACSCMPELQSLMQVRMPCSLCDQLMRPHHIPHYFCKRDDCPSKLSRSITADLPAVSN